MEPERKEIIDNLVESGLVERCVGYQTNKCKDNYLKEELTQEVWLWLCTYDLAKLSDAYRNRHMNALITRFICNQFHSKNSPFFKNQRKFDLLTEEIGADQMNIPDA